MIGEIIVVVWNAAAGLAIVLGAAWLALYFLVLKEPVPLGSDAVPRRRNELRGGEPTTPSAESANWVNTLLIRFAAVVFLGGGTNDATVWSNRLCYIVDRRLETVSQRLATAAATVPGSTGPTVLPSPLPAHSGSSPQRPVVDGLGRSVPHPATPASSLHATQRENAVSIQLESLSLGNVLEAPIDAVGASSRCSGVALPSIGIPGISSSVRASDGATILRVPLEYRDGQLHVMLRCVLPLAFGLGSLGIPSDLLTVRSKVAIHGISFGGLLQVTLRGAEIDLQFASTPRWDAVIETSVGKKREVSGGQKVQEIVTLAIRRMLHKLVAPNALRATLIADAPYIQWSVLAGSGSVSMGTTPRE